MFTNLFYADNEWLMLNVDIKQNNIFNIYWKTYDPNNINNVLCIDLESGNYNHYYDNNKKINDL